MNSVECLKVMQELIEKNYEEVVWKRLSLKSKICCLSIFLASLLGFGFVQRNLWCSKRILCGRCGGWMLKTTEKGGKEDS